MYLINENLNFVYFFGSSFILFVLSWICFGFGCFEFVRGVGFVFLFGFYSFLRFFLVWRFLGIFRFFLF